MRLFCVERPEIWGSGLDGVAARPPADAVVEGAGVRGPAAGCQLFRWASVALKRERG